MIATACSCGGVTVCGRLSADVSAYSREGRPQSTTFDTKASLFHRDVVAPGLVLMCTIASFAAFGAFIPDHARSVGLSSAGGLFLVYSSISLFLRLIGARLPDALGAHPMVTIALLFMAAGMTVLRCFQCGAVDCGSPRGYRNGVQLPAADGSGDRCSSRV